MRKFIVSAIATCFGIVCLFISFGITGPADKSPTDKSPTEYEELKASAEKYYAEGSYKRAYELYSSAEKMELSANDVRWVKFRVADTLWREQSATNNPDSTKYDKALIGLEALIRDITKEEDKDVIWAEVNESIGDFYWKRNGSYPNWYSSWQYYQKALEWWAKSDDIEKARDRYINIVFKAIKNPNQQQNQNYYFGYYGNYLPLEILENVLKIAKKDEDIACAHFAIAMTIRNSGGDWSKYKRVPKEFEDAIRFGKNTEWYDDILYNYANWLESNGNVVVREDGGWNFEPDYMKALEIYRKLTNEFQKGKTRYYDHAMGRIAGITNPVASVSVSNCFLPGSRIQFDLNWRNVKNVEFSLYKVNLVKDITPSRNGGDVPSWVYTIDLTNKEKVKTWSENTNDKGDYKPGYSTIRYEDTLPVGAYIVEAKAIGVSSRDAILVTEATIVTKISKKTGLAYFCNSVDGSPIVEGSVHVWVQYWQSDEKGHYEWKFKESAGYTDSNGIFTFDMPEERTRRYQVHILVAGSSNNLHAFALTNQYDYGTEYMGNYSGENENTWRIYASTDKPAYRPEEKVNWKITGRKYDGSVYSTPANQVLRYEICDARGTRVKEDTAQLNTFGSAWGVMELDSKMVLGEYKVRFYCKGNFIGSAVLFRLEEYKLPEFKVSISVPEENGRKKTFTVGDKIDLTIQADYYFGGPVANANVKVVVKQKFFSHSWQPDREYPWYYEGEGLQPGLSGRRYNYNRPVKSSRGVRQNYYDYGPGQVIKEDVLKTDATGKAVLSFATQENANQDYEYSIEARVTDSSRREIIGNSTVKVTRQEYFIYEYPEHNLYKPKDKVKINIKALDANDQPVKTEGTLKVTRDYWKEIWTGPDGKELSNIDRKKLAKVAADNCRIKYRGYQSEDIVKRTIKTDASGEAEIDFVAEKEGYYNVTWTSKDKNDRQVVSATSVWVSTDKTTDIGYNQSGLEIIVDKDTFKPGQKAPVMLVAPSNDRYVLFCITGDDIYSWQVIHLTGTVKLVELPIDEKHCPNIFLNAEMVADNEIFSAYEEVIVPPVKNFVNVEVKTEKEQYQPGEEGTISVTTLDSDSKPVATELAVGLVDEAVFYIQGDYAGDPRQFFYGKKRDYSVYTESTFGQKNYAKLVEIEKGTLIDEKTIINQRSIGTESEEIGDEYADMSIMNGKENRLGYAGGGVRGGLVNKLMARSQEAKTYPASSPARDASGNMADYLGEKNKRELASSEMGIRGDIDFDGGIGAGELAVQVRTDFRSVMFWQPDIITGADGKATIKVKYPDSLTTWKAVGRAVTQLNQFGIGSANSRTKMPLIVRLQAPRFFVVGDKVTISAVINNNTNEVLTVSPSIKAEGLSNLFARKDVLSVQPNGEERVDYEFVVSKPGIAKIKVEAKSDKYSDAMEKTYPIYEHGIEKYVAKSGKARTNSTTILLDIPAERKKESTTMVVQIAPSMAVTMLDALPYLVHYPYGCVEQTMSRFLPCAVVGKTLKELGLKPEQIEGKIFGGIEKEYAEKTNPSGKGDFGKLNETIQDGLNRLYDFQHSDGGWGWWKEGSSDHFMTAYVAWGLLTAQWAGIDIKPGVIHKTLSDYLDKELVEEELNYDLQAFMLYPLALNHSWVKAVKGLIDYRPSEFQTDAINNLWKNRDKLNAYSRALFALSMHYFGDKEKAEALVRNLENGVIIDDKPDVSVIMEGKQESNESVMATAHWGEDGIYNRWSEGGVQSSAFAIMALMKIDPDNPLIEKAVNWLIKNRRGNQWGCTLETSIAVLALNEYLQVSKEMISDNEYELLVNGKSIVSKKVTVEQVLSAPSQYAIDNKYIKDGKNEIKIVRKGGTGSIYFSANATFFSLEEPITSAGNEIFVQRKYYKIVSKPTLLKGFVYDKLPLEDSGTVQSGERVEVVVTIEGKNNYEYLIFEDLKPAGLEAVSIRSGEQVYAKEIVSMRSGNVLYYVREIKSGDASNYTGRTQFVYQELRDRKVALFIDKLPQGVWEIRYELRAEVPGAFHALPVVGYAMYVPEIKCNGSEVRIQVKDK